LLSDPDIGTSPLKQNPLKENKQLQQDVEHLTRQLSDERRKVRQLRQKQGVEIGGGGGDHHLHEDEQEDNNSFLEGI
jgi:hypothetical protein